MSGEEGIAIRILKKIDPAVFYVILTVLKALQFVVDTAILRPLFGYSTKYGKTEDEERSKVEYEHSAQFVNILFQGALLPPSRHHLGHFFWRHVR